MEESQFPALNNTGSNFDESSNDGHRLTSLNISLSLGAAWRQISNGSFIMAGVHLVASGGLSLNKVNLKTSSQLIPFEWNPSSRQQKSTNRWFCLRMPGVVIKVWELWPSAARCVALRLPPRASFNRFINTPTNRLTATCFRFVAHFTRFLIKIIFSWICWIFRTFQRSFKLAHCRNVS